MFIGHRAARDRRLRGSVLAAVGSRMISTVVLLALTPLLLHTLGLERFGVLVTLTSASAVLGLADLGIANGLISKIAAAGWEAPQTRRLLSAAGVLLVVSSLVTVAAAALLTAVLPWQKWLNAASIGRADLRLATFFALLGAAMSLTTGLGQRIDLARQRGHAVAWWRGAAGVAGPLGALLTALRTDRVAPVVAAAALIPVLILALQTVLTIRDLPGHLRPSARSARRVDIVDSLRTGGVYFGLAVVIAVSFQMDTIIVSSNLGAPAAGEFSLVVRMFGLVGLTVQACVTPLWPAFAEALSRNDIFWVRRTLVRASLIGGGVTAVAGITLVLSGPWLVAVWTRGDVRPSLSLLVGAALWTTYAAASEPLAMLLNGAQLQLAQLLAAIPMAGVNLGLSVVLTRSIGAAGPLFGSVIADALVVALPMGLLVNRRLSASTLRRAGRQSPP